MRFSILAVLALSSQAVASPSVQGVDWVEGDAPILDNINWVEVSGPLGIVNGDRTTEHGNVMAVVAYWDNGQGFQFFSATQVSDDFVLTAAHCAEAGEDYQNQGASLYVARTNDVYQTAENGWFQIKSNGVFIHPDWAGMNSQNIINDVALLQATGPITGTGGPAVLNDEPIDSSWRGKELNFVGFGITDDSAQDSGIKRQTFIPVEDQEFGIVYSYDPTTNVCSGDSGGAAFEQTPDGLELAGVNSFVFQTTQDGSPCNGGANGAARVDSYIDWILEIEPDVATDWGSVVDPGDTTTGDPNDPNTGDPNDPNTGDPNDPNGGDPIEDVGTAGEEGVRGAGCGCSTSSPLSGLWLGLMIFPLARRRS